MTDFSTADEIGARTQCREATAAYAAALVMAGHPLVTYWARRVQPPARPPAEPPSTSKPQSGPAVAEAKTTPAKTATEHVEAIAACGGLTLADLRSPKRTRPLVNARQRAMYELRGRFGWSYPQIGQFLRKDHSTVIHGVRKYAARHGLAAPC